MNEEKNGIMYSIVVPVFNSEQTLPILYKRLVRVMENLGETFEIVFVEDCGRDNSWQVLQTLAEKDERVCAIQLMRNYGQGTATLCGLAHTRGYFAITLDDDLQHPPEELHILIEALRSNDELDVVVGVPKEKRHGLVRNLGSDSINLMNSSFLKKDPKLRFTGFRVMRRTVVDVLMTMRVPYPAIGPMLISTTRRIANVTVCHDPRQEGSSGYTFSRIVRGVLSNFIGYSMLPLQVLAGLGGFGIVVCLILGAFHLGRYLLGRATLPGWTSLMLVLVALSGFNFFAFAVLGEYLIRILYLESTTQQYIVRNRVGAHAGVSQVPRVQPQVPLASTKRDRP